MGQVIQNPGALFNSSEGRKRGQNRLESLSIPFLLYLDWFYIFIYCNISSEEKGSLKMFLSLEVTKCFLSLEVSKLMTLNSSEVG